MRESPSERVQSIKLGARRYICRRFWLFFNFEVALVTVFACPQTESERERIVCAQLQEGNDFSLSYRALGVERSLLPIAKLNKRVNNLSTLLTYGKKDTISRSSVDNPTVDASRNQRNAPRVLLEVKSPSTPRQVTYDSTS